MQITRVNNKGSNQSMNSQQHDERFLQLKDWLTNKLEIKDAAIVLASGDASFRRYFRVNFRDMSYIAMDAPPEKEDCGPFVAVARAFAALGLHVPEVLAEDHEQGFLLLSDLGDQQYLDHLDEISVEGMYQDAMRALLTLQKKGRQESFSLPPYDHALLWREMELFRDWFLGEHLGVDTAALNDALDAVFELLAKSSLEQPQVWVHRDYHSRNLMQTPQNNPGILDFQDAVFGAVTYDLASLLRDCYIAWPINKVEQWVEDYRLRLIKKGVIDEVSEETFLKWFDLMGAQRHLKAIGIFARLNHRDGKSGYLGDIPRTLSYVQQVAEKYPELKPLQDVIDTHVLPHLDLQSGQKK